MAVIRVSADFDGEMAHLLKKENVKFRHITTASYTDFILPASHERFEYFFNLAEGFGKGVWVVRTPRSAESKQKLSAALVNHPKRFRVVRTRYAFITKRPILYVEATPSDGMALLKM